MGRRSSPEMEVSPAAGGGMLSSIRSSLGAFGSCGLRQKREGSEGVKRGIVGGGGDGLKTGIEEGEVGAAVSAENPDPY